MKASQWLHTDLMNLSCNNLRNHFSRGSSCQFPFLLTHTSHPLLILQYASLQHSSIHTFIHTYIHSYLYPSIHARMLNRSSKHAYRDDNYFQRSHLHFLCTSPRHNTRNLLPSKTQHVVQPTRCILSFYLDDNVQRHVCSSDHGNRHAYTFGLVQPPHLNLDCLARPKAISHCQSLVTSRTLHQEDLAQLETTSLHTFDFLDSNKKLHQETIFILTMPKHSDFHSGLLPTYLKTMSTHRNLVPTPLYCRQAPSHFRHLIPQRRPNANQLVTQCCRPPHCKLCQPLKYRHSASPNTHASTNCFKAPTNRHASPRHLQWSFHCRMTWMPQKIDKLDR